jgi:hypothetical protein
MLVFWCTGLGLPSTGVRRKRTWPPHLRRIVRSDRRHRRQRGYAIGRGASVIGTGILIRLTSPLAERKHTGPELKAV